MHVGVELLDKHERTGDRDVTQWLLSPIVNDRGKVGVGKVRQNDLAFRMNASSREVLRNALKASSSRNRMLEGEGSDDEEAPERRGFRAGVDLRLGAIDTTNVNETKGRKRKRQSEKSQVATIIANIMKRKYVCMGNA